MPVKFNPFTGQLQIDEKGSGGGSSYIDGEVQNFSALPQTVGSPAVDSAYLVREAEGAWLLNRKPAGIYIRTANTGTRASDWTYAGEFPDVFNDANLVVYNNTDSTKNVKFDASAIATATTRTLTVPNASGTIQLTGHAAAHASAGSDPLFDQDLNTTDSPAFVDVNATGLLTAANSSIQIGIVNGTEQIVSSAGGGRSIDLEQGFIDGLGINAPTDRTNILDATDATKKAAFDCSAISTATTRTFSFPNADGTFALSGDAPASHTHGNLTNDGKIGSTAGLPVVTTTAGAVTTLALGTANQVLRVNSGATGVEFADPSGGGVTGAAASASDVLGVSGANITGVDANADRIVFWDASSSALRYLEAGSGLSISGTTLTATGTIGGSTGSTDNSLLRSDGTGGSTVQASALVVDDAVLPFSSVTGDAATDVITVTGHNFTTNQGIRFTSLTGGTGLTTTTNYFVRDISGDTFKVSLTSGGAAVNFTSNITAGTVIAMQANVAISQNTTETNSAFIITPKGNGAFVLGPRPDGTSVGGNIRGSQAIDLQLVRDTAAQIASGSGAILISDRSTASNGCVIGGQANSSSGSQAGVFCGNANSASAASAVAIGGSRGVADRANMIVHACGRFSANGDAQRFRVVMRGTTTTNSAIEMFVDTIGSVRLTVPSGKVMAMLLNITGVKSDGSAVAHYVRQYAIKNVGGTTSEVYAAVTVGTDNAASTSISLSASDTNDALKLDVTGIASETWRWVASVDAVEVAYGT